MEFNGTFIVAFVSFVVFTVVMNLILYKPINSIVQKRKAIVDANYEEAEKNSVKKDEILHERDEKLSKATDEAKELVTSKTIEANNQKDEITLKAKKEAQKNIEAYNLYYKNATSEAKDFLKTEVVSLAQAISDKFLGEDEKINVDENKELLDSITQG